MVFGEELQVHVFFCLNMFLESLFRFKYPCSSDIPVDKNSYHSEMGILEKVQLIDESNLESIKSIQFGILPVKCSLIRQFYHF